VDLRVCYSIEEEGKLSNIIAFEPHRFESAAQYYLDGRPKYAQRLIRRVAALLGFNGTQRLLDLGTGPGQLALAFAPYVGEVTAIDPEPQMLRIAAEQAAKAGVRLNLQEGNSYTLDEALGRFDLVTIGRAFHWMDRTRTLETLDKLIRPNGAVALFATRHPTLPENGWHKDYDAMIDSYGEADSPRRARRSPDWVPHETILLDSPFSELERASVIERRLTPLDGFVSRALSFSISSPGRIGGRADELASAVRTTLSPYATGGMIPEVVESEALLAFRPSEAATCAGQA
jgi:SAM-dependent methyltransferase